MIREFNKKVKNFNEDGPYSIWAAFSAKIVPQAKFNNGAFWNIVNSIVC